MPTPENKKEHQKGYEKEKVVAAVDFSDFTKTIDEVFKIQAEKIEDGKEIKEFVRRLREDSVPAIQDIIQMLVPTYAYKRELTDLAIAYEIFLKVVELDDARVKKIAAEVIKRRSNNK